ncbi:PilW family protein [Janthinobacterium sp. RB2R34]|uniref:PilW family protein n=1 Tax=Janthinobacterium sp. RB2R34 TaxID=3424193 RepID=UPI003F225FC0
MNCHAQHQAGMTLVELLVALGLGAMLMLASSTVLLSSSRSYLDQVESARLADNGRYAFDAIARALRQTAWVNWDASAAPSTHAAHDSANIAGLDAHGLGKNTDGISAPLAGSINGSDVLALRFYGTGEGAGGDGSVLNCAGFGIGSASNEAQRGWSIFYVAQDDGGVGDGEAELRCKYRSAGGSGWGADALIRGVDSFQVLYGLDTDTPPDGVANQYVNATTLDARDAALVLVGADQAERERDFHRRTHWKRVASVRVALLLHGSGNLDAQPGPAQFDLFGPAYADAHGAQDPGVRIVPASLPPTRRGRLRHLVQATIVLRNGPA